MIPTRPELLNQGASVVLRDVQVRLSCPAGSPVLSWSRGASFAYPYQIGTPFPVNLPAAMPVFDTLDCDTALDEGAAPQALSFALAEAQPNPFNPATSLSYTLPTSSNVTLRVFNPGGQLVRTLAQGPMPRGVHSVLFDASRLASGLYLCRLESNGQAVTRKLLYLK